MKTITIEVSDADYSIMCLRLLDPQAHLANFAETMVHHAMQELGYSTGNDGQYSDADIKEALNNSSAAEREAARKAQEKAAADAALTAKELQDKLDKERADKEAEAQAQQAALAAEQHKQDVLATAKTLMADVMPAMLKELRQQAAAAAQAGVKK